MSNQECMWLPGSNLVVTSQGCVACAACAGPSLLTVHNIHFMTEMMAGIRQAILNDEI